MRTLFRTAALSLLLPTALQTQEITPNAFQVLPPSLTYKVEKCRDFDRANIRWVNDLTMDSAGFLWCASTLDGLVRFDGYEARWYHDDSPDTLKRSRAAFTSVVVDSQGDVWCASPTGLRRLDPATGRSRWYMNNPRDTTSVLPISPALLLTTDGELWTAGSRGIAKYNRQSDSFIFFAYPQSFVATSSPHIPSMQQIGRNIWIGLHSAGIVRFGRDDKSWKLYTQNASDSSGPTSNQISVLRADRSGYLWVGSEAGLERYDPSTNEWKRPDSWGDTTQRIPQGWYIYGVAEDDFGGIWVSVSRSGLFRIDPKDGRLLQFKHEPANPESLPFDQMLGIQSIRQGGHPAASTVFVTVGYWGTWRIVIREEPCTRIIFNRPEELVPRCTGQILHEPTGNLWAGVSNTNGSAARLDTRARTCRAYPGPVGIAQMARLTDGSILALGSGRMWMRDVKRDTFVTVAPDLNVSFFFVENDSSVWLGCSSPDFRSYLAFLNRRTGTYAVFPNRDSIAPDYQELGVFSKPRADNDGFIWYGTYGAGLVRFDRIRKNYQRYLSRPGTPDALCSNRVSVVLPDSGAKLWVGTVEGLDLMDCKRGTFEHIPSPHPMNELYIEDMVDDGMGHIWIASLPVVACFTKATRTFRILPIPKEFRWPVPFCVSLDRTTRIMSVGMAGGLFSFSIDNPPVAPEAPRVAFTSFKVFEKPYALEKDISVLQSITLPHAASFFSLTFAALDHVDPAAIQYSYRMDGVNQDWILSGSRRYVSYSNLDAGKYVLRVRATNREGTWSDQERSIEITILPPWYRTFWAYGAYALLGGTLLFIAWRFDRRRTAVKHQMEMREFQTKKILEMDQMKSRFFANISHEFRTPLTLILGPLEQLLAKNKDEESQTTFSVMRRNGLRLLQLINQLLDLSRLDSGKMTIQVRPTDLVSLSRALVMSFISLAERKKIHLIFDPEADQLVGYVDKDKFEKILTNLLSNAFKFTGDGGEIRVVLRPVDETADRWVEMSVADTGIGISAEHIGKIFDRFYQVDSAVARENEGTGIGLALTKELVELHKGTITVQSEQGRGSRFTVRLPVGKEQWSEKEIAPGEVDIYAPQSRVVEDLFPEAETPKAKTGRDITGRPVVLIVEDNADVRGYVRGFLSESYEVLEAGNGKEALKSAQEATVDLVISDVMMPEMDGIELCRTLKNDERTSHIPVILLTARATSEGKLEGLDIGADDYVIKPFDAREVLARVKNLIMLRRNLRAKYGQQFTLTASTMEVTTLDERFLKNLKEKIEQHIGDPDYDTETVAYDMCMSRMQLNRKLHALTGYSTHGLVREFRLQRAAELLKKHAGSVADVAYEVGFNNLSHFARVFRERFGVAPSEYDGGRVTPESMVPSRQKE
jgi:signal transduction histidine kinase/DNA-binding response OmpR family regulator/ligand-binding sensor domain-containing protein